MTWFYSKTMVLLNSTAWGTNLLVPEEKRKEKNLKKQQHIWPFWKWEKQQTHSSGQEVKNNYLNDISLAYLTKKTTAVLKHVCWD